MNPFVAREELRRRCKDPRFCIVCFQSRSNVKVDGHHVCQECRKDTHGTARTLPAVTLRNGKTYFLDQRLRQLRNVDNPHDYIDLDVR